MADLTISSIVPSSPALGTDVLAGIRGTTPITLEVETISARSLPIGGGTLTGGLGVGSTGLGAGEMLAVRKDSVDAQLIIAGVSSWDKQLRIGYNTTDNYGAIQASQSGVGYTRLVLNPGGGNVGIGTTEPSTLLSNTSVNFNDGITAAPASQLSWLTNSVGPVAAFYNYDNERVAHGLLVKTRFDQAYNDTYIFNAVAGVGASGGVSRFYVTAGGNVGIGTVSPTAILHVIGVNTGLDPASIIESASPSIELRDSSQGADTKNISILNTSQLFVIRANNDAHTSFNNLMYVTRAGQLVVPTMADYADNAAAVTAGMVVGAFYRSGDLLKVVHA